MTKKILTLMKGQILKMTKKIDFFVFTAKKIRAEPKKFCPYFLLTPALLNIIMTQISLVILFSQKGCGSMMVMEGVIFSRRSLERMEGWVATFRHVFCIASVRDSVVCLLHTHEGYVWKIPDRAHAVACTLDDVQKSLSAGTLELLIGNLPEGICRKDEGICRKDEGICRKDAPPVKKTKQRKVAVA